MKRTGAWVNALFALVFIAAPAMVGFVFFLPGFGELAKHTSVFKELWFYWVAAIGFLTYVGLISWLLIHFEWLGYDSLNFNIPIALVFMMLFVSYDWPKVARICSTIAIVLVAFPTNMIVQRLYWKKAEQIKQKNRK